MLPESLTLYGARHAFATYAVQATGNLFAVADVLGHQDLKTTRIYQHPEFRWSIASRIAPKIGG